MKTAPSEQAYNDLGSKRGHFDFQSRKGVTKQARWPCTLYNNNNNKISHYKWIVIVTKQAWPRWPWQKRLTFVQLLRRRRRLRCSRGRRSSGWSPSLDHWRCWTWIYSPCRDGDDGRDVGDFDDDDGVGGGWCGDDNAAAAAAAAADDDDVWLWAIKRSLMSVTYQSASVLVSPCLKGFVLAKGCV